MKWNFFFVDLWNFISQQATVVTATYACYTAAFATPLHMLYFALHSRAKFVLSCCHVDRISGDTSQAVATEDVIQYNNRW